MRKWHSKAFTYKEFMKKLGLKGNFDTIHNIIASTKGKTPRLEIDYYTVDKEKLQ